MPLGRIFKFGGGKFAQTATLAHKLEEALLVLLRFVHLEPRQGIIILLIWVCIDFFMMLR